MSETVFEDYIPNLIDSMLLNLKVSETNFLLLKHYNTFDLSAEYIKTIFETRKQALFLYHSFEAEDMLGVYEPFLEWVKQFYIEFSDESVDDFLEQNGVYLLHRPVFKSYFEKGFCERKEEILINEIKQEEQYFAEEIARMLCKFSEQKPMMIVFNKLHAAGRSTIRLIKKLLSGGNTRNIALLATYNELAPELDYVKDDWSELVAEFDARDSVVDWTLSTVTFGNESNNRFQFDGEKLEEYYVKLNNMYNMLALDQLDFYLDIFYHKTEMEKVDIDPGYKFTFLEMHARTAMFKDKTSDALLYCNGMGRMMEENDNADWAYRYYYLAAQIHMYSLQQDMAGQYAKKCEEVCKNMNDPFLMFRVELLKYLISVWGWRNIWSMMKDEGVDESLLDQAVKYEYINHVAHIYVYSFDSASEKYRDIDIIEEQIPNFNKGINIALELGNAQLVVEAYKRNVMIASVNGYYDVANYFCGKYYEIVSRDNDLFEEAGIYNGMGYNCCTMEQYTKANEYFNKALLIHANRKDMESINETIYNMAVNAILAEEYVVAEGYLRACLKIVKIMKSNSVRVCNISKVYGLRAYCCYKMDVLYNCKINLQYMEQFLGHLIELNDKDMCESHMWDDDLFLYHFVGGLLAEHENKLVEAYTKMQKAEKYVNRSTGSEFFNRAPYSVGYARICRKLGYEKQAQEILLKCLTFCDAKGYIYKKNMVKAALEGKEYAGMKWNLSIKGISIEGLLKEAVKKGLEKDYEEQKKEINFLSIWQKFINNTETSIERMIANSITTLKNYYNIDEFIFIRMEEGKSVIRYNDSSCDFNEERIQYLVRYFTSNRSEFAITRLDKGYVEHKEMIRNVFGVNAINSLICAPIFVNEQMSGLFVADVLIGIEWNYKEKRYEFDDNDLSVLMMLFRQLLDSIERMEARQKIENINDELQFVNEQLKELAVKDTLTGLYNRQGFLDELDIQLKMARHKKKRMELTFLYADLDNFKYYNDTFGHDVGDMILKEFAALISGICDCAGYAVRYGGDEFILVLFTNDRQEVEQAAKDIYGTLEKREGFRQSISEKMGEPIEIPQEKWLSCSIGISQTVIGENDVIKDKLEETLKRADEMMYLVKKTTKHRYVFYEEKKGKADC